MGKTLLTRNFLQNQKKLLKQLSMNAPCRLSKSMSVPHYVIPKEWTIQIQSKTFKRSECHRTL